MSYTISGIQQVGIGIPDAKEAWDWYRQRLGCDVQIFEEAAEAGLMLPYTGGKPHHRYAILALNMNGGGGFEIWQYTSRTPQPADFDIQLGDLGIHAIKIKSYDVKATYAYHSNLGTNFLSALHKAPDGGLSYFFQDPYGNVFQIVESEDWFQKKNYTTGGIYGTVMGVTDIEKSLRLYRDLLGYDEVVYDVTNTFDEFGGMLGGKGRFRRVLLRHSQPREGAFAPLLGASEIELVQALDRTPRKMFENRYWGDLGYIHLCFDVRNMDALEKRAEELGFPFTVDSKNSFDMGEAAGRFTYIEDPDGSWIEFVETHKVPILKKWGLYLHLKNRDPKKALPRFVLKALGLNRKKA